VPCSRPRCRERNCFGDQLWGFRSDIPQAGQGKTGAAPKISTEFFPVIPPVGALYCYIELLWWRHGRRTSQTPAHGPCPVVAARPGGEVYAPWRSRDGVIRQTDRNERAFATSTRHFSVGTSIASDECFVVALNWPRDECLRTTARVSEVVELLGEAITLRRRDLGVRGIDPLSSRQTSARKRRQVGGCCRARGKPRR
jgi:hypothetical protein